VWVFRSPHLKARQAEIGDAPWRHIVYFITELIVAAGRRRFAMPGTKSKTARATVSLSAGFEPDGMLT